MYPISSSQSTKIQNTFEIGTTTPAAVAAAPQATQAKGDTVTISDQGRALAKAASGKGDGETSAPIKIDTGQAASTATTSEALLTEALQDAQVKQKSLQGKLAAAQQQEKANPQSGSQVASLNAQLRDANTTVTKAQVKVYS